MRKRRQIELFSLSFLDLISGALGAVIILYVAVPKNHSPVEAIQAKPVPEVIDLSPQVQSLQSQNEVLKQQNRELQEKVTQVIQAYDELKMNRSLPKEQSKSEGHFDVGFRFKGKKIVFVLDTSKSMLDENRMGEVKAGLKMLLTGMPPQYAVDVVAFPDGMKAPYKTFWGQLKNLSLLHKSQLFEFLYSLSPEGGTPTRQALSFVFEHYPDVTDIVLLTDGEPSLHNSMVKDDIYDLLSQVMRMNKNKVQISTIGVGGEVLKDHTSTPYQFMKLLAEQNAGFFVGF